MIFDGWVRTAFQHRHSAGQALHLGFRRAGQAMALSIHVPGLAMVGAALTS